MSSRLRRKPEAGPSTAAPQSFADAAAGRGSDTGSRVGSGDCGRSDESAEPPGGPASSDVEGACRRAAVALLARREHSRLELERKLAARSHRREVVTAVLDVLEAEGLLAADRFIESFVRTRAARGFGPVRIALELAERGIGGGEGLLREAGYDWPALAAAVRVKRFGPARPADFKARARQARFLEYRGFSSEQIARALEIGADSD